MQTAIHQPNPGNKGIDRPKISGAAEIYRMTMYSRAAASDPRVHAAVDRR